jgi:raffinose/stachyose/melibiose transport system substrate-binding protein
MFRFFQCRRSLCLCGTVAICALVPFLLGGCALPGGGSAASGVSVLRIWYSTDDPVERVWSQQLAQRFQASHPKVRVRLTDYTFEDLNTKLQLALSAGDPPDLAYVTPRGPGIPAFVAAHRLRDLTVAARAHHWASRLLPELLASYNRPFSFLGAGRGSVMAVPTSLAAVGVLYNRRLLTRLHLSVPESLSAFEQALARARAAGYTPIGLGNADGWLGDDWYLTLVNALVGPAALQSEQQLSRSFTFRQPPLLQAARILQRWSQRGYFTSNFGGLDAQEGVDAFFQGRTLFQLISSSENAQIRQDQRQSGLPVGVFAFPGPGGGRVVPVSGYLGWVVPAASRNPNEAIAFINSLLSLSTARFLLDQSVLPAYRSSGWRGQTLRAVPGWEREYLQALRTAAPGVYLDAAPVANLNATMEANVQLLLQGYEPPQFLVKSLQEVYASRGSQGGSTARIDGEF